MTFATPAAVMQRLSDIEADLGTRQNEYEDAAGDRARLIREWDHRLAVHTAKADGPNAEARKAQALIAAIAEDDLYERLTSAEASFDALKAVTRTLETRATIGQSILRAQGRG